MHMDELREGIDRCLKDPYKLSMGVCCVLNIVFDLEEKHTSSYDFNSPMHLLYQKYCVSMGDDIDKTYWHDVIGDNEASNAIRVERLNGFRDWLIANNKYQEL